MGYTTKLSIRHAISTSLLIVFSVLVTSCERYEPVKIGIVAGLSGRNSDLGEGGRNGALLAIEQYNQRGGIHGKPIQILIKDDGNTEATAQKSAQELIAAKVNIIIGPFNSAMSAAMLPLVNQAHTVLLSPTASALSFAGKDDYFIRLNWTTRENARFYAEWIFNNGHKRTALAYDLQNAIFSQSWSQEFKAAYAALGGQISQDIPYDAKVTAPYSSISRKMLQSQADCLLFISNSVDTTRFAQQIREHNSSIPIFTSEWAEIEQVIDLGGKAVEGMLIARTVDTHSQAPAYLQFVADYKTRFKLEPSYTSVAAYDAAQIALEAISKQSAQQSLKESILQRSPYPGLQKPIHIDQYGDAKSRALYAQVRDGQIVILP